MFNTFPSGPEESSESVLDEPKYRTKRRQVQRACARCRLHRIKCDAQSPCKNCSVKGQKCTTDDGRNGIRTFPSAIKEIDRLRERVKVLENQLQRVNIHSYTFPDPTIQHGPTFIKREHALPEELDPLGQHGINRNYYNWAFATRVTRPGSYQAYGSSSTFYFIDQLSGYMNLILQQPLPCWPRASHIKTLFPPPHSRDDFAGAYLGIQNLSLMREDLPKEEENRLLELYWNYYHILYPILDEKTVKMHHKSLWDTSDVSRGSSALVDVLLALCIQYESGLAVSGPEPRAPSRKGPADSTAGYWLFRRCQHILQDELQEPSITTFECYALSVLWLSRACWHNAAHNALAAGLRVGVIIGLHLEPSFDLSTSVRESRRRIWWTMYSIDAQYAMEYGRPISVNFAQVTCNLPKDEEKVRFPESESLIPTSFNTQMIRLILAARSIYILFHRKCAEVLRINSQNSLNQSPESLEICAQWLEAKTDYLKAWLRQLPESLKTPRQSPGQSFSTDRSRLDLNHFQDHYNPCRIILELFYHYLSMSVYRVFITFMRAAPKSNPVTEQHAISCVNHAITITKIINQDLTEEGHLQQWQITSFAQLSAGLGLIGYLVTRPRGSIALEAHKAVHTAMDNFIILQQTFASARGAAEVLGNLLYQVDLILADLQPLAPNKSNESIKLTGKMLPMSNNGIGIGSGVANANGINQFNTVHTGTKSYFAPPSFDYMDDNIVDENWSEFLDFGAVSD